MTSRLDIRSFQRADRVAPDRGPPRLALSVGRRASVCSSAGIEPLSGLNSAGINRDDLPALSETPFCIRAGGAGGAELKT
jgi:hypothetical protein